MKFINYLRNLNSFKRVDSFFKKYLPWSIVAILAVWLIYTLNFLHIGLGVFVKKLFWTPSQGFAWTSLTGLAALFGVFINIWSQKKSVQAQVISKERTRWLSNHKIIMAQYISDSMECIQHLQVLNNYNIGSLDLNWDNIAQTSNEIAEKTRSIQKNRFLLLLELTSHNEENKTFLHEIDETYFKVDNATTQVRLAMKDLYSGLVGNDNELLLDIANAQIHTLLITASNYYQSVWIQIKE